MSHTKKNLREVDDSAPRFGLSETQEARFAAGISRRNRPE
jgi:hypothetical protein